MSVYLQYDDLIDAWKGINKSFFKTPSMGLPQSTSFIKVLGNAMYWYNVVIDIDKPIFDEDFDFGRQFNYTKNKWSILIKNYINFHALEQFKELLNKNINSKKFYNINYSFDNNHQHGKECLLYMLATKRYGKDNTPYLTFYLRASEITKRLAVDFLLAKRIGDYLFENTEYKITFIIQQLFQDDVVLLMFHAFEDIRPFLNHYSKTDKRSKNLLVKLDKLQNSNECDIKYKVHKRAYKVLRPDLYKYPRTLAKDCKLK